MGKLRFGDLPEATELADGIGSIQSTPKMRLKRKKGCDDERSLFYRASWGLGTLKSKFLFFCTSRLEGQILSRSFFWAGDAGCSRHTWLFLKAASMSEAPKSEASQLPLCRTAFVCDRL